MDATTAEELRAALRDVDDEHLPFFCSHMSALSEDFRTVRDMQLAAVYRCLAVGADEEQSRRSAGREDIRIMLDGDD
jgi:hypothetical protein